MEIKIPIFKREEIEVRETYIDENGEIKEKTKTISVPTKEVIGYEIETIDIGDETKQNDDNQ